jgi:hypothetical protein
VCHCWGKPSGLTIIIIIRYSGENGITELKSRRSASKNRRLVVARKKTFEKIFSFTVQDEGDELRVRLTLVLPKRRQPPTKRQRTIIRRLAVAVVGLVLLLVFQLKPALGYALLRLLNRP